MDSPALLVKVRGDGSAFKAALGKGFGSAEASVEAILKVPATGGGGLGLGAPAQSTWLRVGRAGSAATPWDLAHGLALSGESFAASGGAVEAVEPDLEQQWAFRRSNGVGDSNHASPGAAAACRFDDQSTDGNKAVGPGVAWNFANEFSQLAGARAQVGDKLGKILIAHLDTGFDPAHSTLPVNLKRQMQRNFVDRGLPNDATDHTPEDAFLTNRGHGTGTLSLLAGSRLSAAGPPWDGFQDVVGAAALAGIIPVRIADGVVRFTTGTMVQGFNYACEQNAHVLSMSMGGQSSQALVDAVNVAYESGLVMVTAAGNNFAGIPTPKSIVFPARLKRVLAACGVMADGRAYADLAFRTMQGNYGPAEKMQTALSAYTPNVPWAQIGCPNIVDMDGAGTSAATPQIAAAVALWLAEHWEIVSRYSEPWMRIEAVRHALFSTAQKSTARLGAAETLEKLGQGVMQAHAALGVAPMAEALLRPLKLPPAKSSWAWIDLLFGGGVSFARGVSPARRAMLALELTQMAQRSFAVDEAIDDPDRPADAIPEAAWKRYLEAVLEENTASGPLRALLEEKLGKPAMTVASAAFATKSVIKREVKEPPTPSRRLRVYALDPSIGNTLASFALNETVLSITWDDLPVTKEALGVGPVGEYLEVVDVDPASDKVYEPVDLNDKKLLAQDGWKPSEGNPQFHQQMVYAVGMTTIRHFETALGRRALWAPHYEPDDSGELHAHEVRRLRIYPHALRADNAYYSPQKVALLFGYFPSGSSYGDATAPGSMVFSCLSSDIIAHEMSHALLDGLHRKFQEASNPDVPAFHEAFADIVALFQHFTVTELVNFEIGRAHGKLSGAALLGGLAKQFGEGVSRCGPLRNYVDPKMKDLKYADTQEVHDRGSILVFAVYEAFLNIVARRTDDLIRLATGGTGVLPQGSLHPDLVARLTEETCKIAKHVLHICIRALDYCPAVDITFGEYLRALITSDTDLVPNDTLGYRVAFLEAFRSRGILPRDVRTISQESLAWNTLAQPSPDWLAPLIKGIDIRWDQDIDRSEVFRLNNENRKKLHAALAKIFADKPAVYEQFGLMPDVPKFNRAGAVSRVPKKGDTTFEVHSVRPARRIGPDGTFRVDLVVSIHQRQALPIDGHDVKNGWFWFRGGATLILDPREGKEAIRYAIVKNSGSVSRQERQRQTVTGSFMSPLQALYFGRTDSEPFAAMHASYRGLDNV